MATISSDVATGLRMKGEERLMASPSPSACGLRKGGLDPDRSRTGIDLVVDRGEGSRREAVLEFPVVGFHRERLAVVRPFEDGGKLVGWEVENRGDRLDLGDHGQAACVVRVN